MKNKLNKKQKKILDEMLKKFFKEYKETLKLLSKS